MPWKKRALDTVEHSVSRNQDQYILTTKDCFAKWVGAFPTSDKLASTVTKILEKEMFAHYSLPEQIHSDPGMQFTSKALDSICNLLHVTKTQTPSGHPKSNPVERMHGDLSLK